MSRFRMYRSMLAATVVLFGLGASISFLVYIPYTQEIVSREKFALDVLATDKAEHVNQLLTRFRDVAKQIASRTRARELLQELNDQRIEFRDYQQKVGDILADALITNPNIAGITRFDVNGAPTVAVGQAPVAPVGVEASETGPASSSFFRHRDRVFVAFRSAIINRRGQGVGHDVVTFDVSDPLLSVMSFELAGVRAWISLGGKLRDASTGDSLEVKQDEFVIEKDLMFVANNLYLAVPEEFVRAGAVDKAKKLFIAPMVMTVLLVLIVWLFIRRQYETEQGTSDKLEEQKAFLNSIIDSLPLAMFCKDYKSGTGFFVDWNKSAENLWGLQKHEVVGKSDYDFFPEDQANFFKEKDLETIRSGDLLYIEEEDVDSPSGKVIVRTWKVPIDGRYLLGISQDITEQKNLEKQLESQKVVAIQSSKMAALGEMSGGIAHEINNPLAIIKGHVAILQKLHSRNILTDEDFKERTATITKTIGRLKAIVDGLRSFSRDGCADSFEPASVKEIVDDALSLSQERFLSHGIDLRVNLTASDDLIACRKIQLSQVLINLLNNARSATEAASDKWVEVGAFKERDTIKITVTDSGRGIDAAIRAKLFQPFFTTKDVGQGTGLGLSISKGLIEDHDGKIYLDESCENTRFVIELPLKATSRTAA